MKLRSVSVWNAIHVITVCTLITLGISGCGPTAIQPAAITPELPQSKKRNPHSVALDVTGGREGEAQESVENVVLPISNDTFRKALATAVQKSGVFAKVATGAADYRLDTFISYISHPWVGGTMTATIEVGWTLINLQTGQRVWREAITTTSDMAFGGAFSAATRLRLAVESAAKKNIEEGIRRMSLLEL